MTVELTGEIESDGCVDLAWRATDAVQSTCLLIIRTGSVPAFTSLRLAGDVTSYRIQNLSRHQRYRIAALCACAQGNALSGWLDMTPRAGLAVIAGAVDVDMPACVARISRVMVMPQDHRLTLYWTMTRGFADRVVVEVLQGGRVWRRLEVEPEVTSLALDAARGVPLANGTAYAVRVLVSFAGTSAGAPESLACTPAPPGQERAANRAHPQEHFLYPRLAVSPEVRLFPDEGAPAEDAPPSRIVCCHCRREVQWCADRLLCTGCRAEFIPNSRGELLDAARLRFGTCRCCAPPKILVQTPAGALTCSHSGKEHVQVAGARKGAGRGLQLIEDLPYGLCQCCRPRRPLALQGTSIACTRTRETHRNEGGRYVLVPSQPVFDAAAIDDLLDAGLAEICATGVTARPSTPRRN